MKGDSSSLYRSVVTVTCGCLLGLLASGPAWPADKDVPSAQKTTAKGTRPIPGDLLEALKLAENAAKTLERRNQIEEAEDLRAKTEALLEKLGGQANVLPDKPLLPAGVAPGNRPDAAKQERTGDQLVRGLKRRSGSVFDIVRRIFAPFRAVVVSGGVSMGSYQAGFLYYYTRALRFYDERLGGGADWANGRFQIATGASAGSINSFLAALDGCVRPDINLDPTASLFFKTWTGIGLKQLIPHPPAPSADGLFSDGAFDQKGGPIKLIEDLWSNSSSWSAGPCQASLGFTATRLAPRRVHIVTDQIRSTAEDDSNVLKLDRMTEKFLLSMDKGPNGFGPVFGSKRVDDNADELYPTLGDGSGLVGPTAVQVTPKQVFDLLRASSAFPFAFHPRTMPITIWSKTNDGYARDYEASTRFTDGGFLDNTPLRIAQKLAKTMAPAATDPQSLIPGRVLLLMSGAQSWKPSEHNLPSATGDDRESVLGRYLPFVFNFLSTASDGALIDVFEDDGGGLKYDIPMRGFPIAADQLGHFFAFIEPSFRTFDFYQGMIDAEELISGQVAPGLSIIPFKNGGDLECFRDYRRRARAAHDSVPPLGALCASTDANLTALLQASARRKLTVKAGDDDLQEFVSALKIYHYKYRELASGQELTASDVMLRVREDFDRLESPFTDAQPGISKLAVVVAAPTAVDLWYYRPRTYLGIGVPGDATLQGILSVPMIRGHVWTLRAQTEGYIGLYPRKATFMDGAESVDLWRYPLQLGIGPSVEYALGKSLLLELGLDGVFRTEYLGGEDFAYRRWGLEAHLSAALGERVYVSLSPEYFFGDCAGNDRCNTARYAQFKPAFIAPAQFLVRNGGLRFSMGWRFLF